MTTLTLHIDNHTEFILTRHEMYTDNCFAKRVSHLFKFDFQIIFETKILLVFFFFHVEIGFKKCKSRRAY